MQLEWVCMKIEDIEIDCPFCGKRSVPPEYPYCDHVLFTYLNPCIDNDEFEYLRADIERSYRLFVKMIKLDEEYEDLLEDNPDDLFLQSIKELTVNKSSEKFGNHLTYLEQLEDLKVFDITESEGFYPTRVVIGFTSSLLNE